MASAHDKVETNIGLMIILVIAVISVGGLVQIVPLFFQDSLTEPVAGLKPYSALRLEGRDIYVREGCYLCHSQMIRPFRAETERYGHYSVAGEFVYDRPFQWGSKRTGPDLARVGGKYSNEWHWAHFKDPRNMGEKFRSSRGPYESSSVMQSFRFLSDEQIEDLTAYLQTLGRNKNWRVDSNDRPLNDYED